MHESDQLIVWFTYKVCAFYILCVLLCACMYVIESSRLTVFVFEDEKLKRNFQKEDRS